MQSFWIICPYYYIEFIATIIKKKQIIIKTQPYFDLFF